MNLKRPFFHFFLLTSFLISSILPANRLFAFENATLNLPAPGSMVVVSQPLVPVMLKGLHINPKDPLVLDFLVSKGDVAIEKGKYSKEIEQLARYFLASMALPENELWVNLSPFEKEKIITDSLSQTEMGQHMLAQDYLLKQLTASMIYPEKELGKQFWSRVYAQAKKQFGSAEIPVNTFNKVWILADTATAVEKNNAVLITDTHLKVMLEEDFLALKRNQGRVALTPATTEEHIVASNIIRQIILPEIEKEVNTGANFAPLRQIFNAFVLSAWYKKTLKQAILNEVYTDKSKLGGIESEDLQAKQKIYDRYVQAYKKGVFNYIKEEDNGQQKRIPRKYFSGGERISSDNAIFVKDAKRFDAAMAEGKLDKARISFQTQDAAMNAVAASNEHNVLDSTNAVKIKELEVFLEDKTTRGLIKDITEEHITDELRKSISKYVPSASDVDQIRIIKLNISGAKHKRYQGLLKYGYAVDWDQKTIYVTDAFEEIVKNHPSNLLEFYARKVIKMLSPDSDSGRQNEHAYVNEREDLKEDLRRLFPEGVPLPGDIKEDMKEEFFLANGVNVREALRKAGINLNRYDFQDASSGDIQANVAAQKALFQALDIIAINAMDGITDYRKQFSSDPRSLRYITEPFSVGGLFSKLNPKTIAHIVINEMSVFALSGVNGYFFSPTKKDIRKPDVERSYDARMKLAKRVSESLFKNLLTILNVGNKIKIGEKEYDLSEWNGEETVALLLLYAMQNNRLLGKLSRFVYPYGSDHDNVFTPAKQKKGFPATVQFDEIDETNEKYVTFFLYDVPHGVENFAKLIKRQHQFSLTNKDEKRFFVEDNSPEEKRNKELVLGILAAEKPDGTWDTEAILALVKRLKVLPRLDVVGKMYLIQKAVGNFAEIILAHNVRVTDIGKDALRDDLIRHNEVKVLSVNGIAGDISATNIRRAFTLFAYGVVNLGLFGGVTLTSLKEILADSNRGLLDYLMRQSGVTLPRSLALMINPDSTETKQTIEKANAIKQGLPSGWKAIESATDYEILPKGDIKSGMSQIIVLNNSDKHYSGQHVNIDYQVYEEFSASGEKSTTVTYKLSMSPHLEETLKMDIKNKLIQYVRTLNGATQMIENKDAAMGAKTLIDEAGQMVVSISDVGGIELNNKDLKLNVSKDGQGIKFEIDPQLLEQLRSDNFGGFKPTVLDITPMSVSSPILN